MGLFFINGTLFGLVIRGNQKESQPCFGVQPKKKDTPVLAFQEMSNQTGVRSSEAEPLVEFDEGVPIDGEIGWVTP